MIFTNSTENKVVSIIFKQYKIVVRNYEKKKIKKTAKRSYLLAHTPLLNLKAENTELYHSQCRGRAFSMSSAELPM